MCNGILCYLQSETSEIDERRVEDKNYYSAKVPLALSAKDEQLA